MTGDNAAATVVAVDLGTGGPKVGLVGLDGTVHWDGFRPAPTLRPCHDRALQDAEDWWRSVVLLVREGLATGIVDPASVVAVGVTGQWGSTVPVDANGRPVAHARLWLDTSAAAHSRDIVGGPALGYHPTRLATWVRRTAGVPSTFGGDPVSHMLGFLRDEPDVAARTRWFLEPVDYLTTRLTGRATATPASMSAAWLVDVRGPRPLAYDRRLVRLAGLDAARLPPLVRSGSVVGPVDRTVSESLGIPPGAVVVAGMPDVHAAHVGSGAVAEGAAHMAISTTSWISCRVPSKHTDAIHSIATIPALGDDGFLVADNHEAAGACLAWLRDQGWAAEFEDLTAEAATAATGSGNVVFTPWLAGLRSPVDDRLARGGWHNASLATTRADLVRSVLEGVAYQARWLLDPVEKLAGSRFDSIRILGGGARSDLWCQIHADAMDRRIERVADPMTGQLRGVALAAGVGIGALAWADVPRLVPVDRTFEPNPDARRIYARLADELPKLYRCQKRTFGRLARG